MTSQQLETAQEVKLVCGISALKRDNNQRWWLHQRVQPLQGLSFRPKTHTHTQGKLNRSRCTVAHSANVLHNRAFTSFTAAGQQLNYTQWRWRSAFQVYSIVIYSSLNICMFFLFNFKSAWRLELQPLVKTELNHNYFGNLLLNWISPALGEMVGQNQHFKDVGLGSGKICGA